MTDVRLFKVDHIAVRFLTRVPPRFVRKYIINVAGVCSGPQKTMGGNVSQEDMHVAGQWREPDVLEWYDLNQGEEGDPLNKDLIAPAVFGLLGDISSKDVLDSGCGSGYFTA